MEWSVDFSSDSIKFLKKNPDSLSEKIVISLATLAIKKLQGQKVSLDLKRLRGSWNDYFRIRKGKLRIILNFDFDNQSVFIKVIDWRGGVYK